MTTCTDDELRTTAGRIMSGIQFFEAQIDDQLLPRAAYDDLLARHGFTDIGSHPLTPMLALTYGRNPGHLDPAAVTNRTPGTAAQPAGIPDRCHLTRYRAVRAGR